MRRQLEDGPWRFTPKEQLTEAKRGCLHSIFGTGVFSLGDEVEK